MSGLSLIRLPVDRDALARWAAVRNYGWADRRGPGGALRGANFDEGRALHHLLAETLGKGRLQPFRLIPAPRGAAAQLYAYTRSSRQELLDEAHATALPEALAVCEVTSLAEKPMPTDWRSGRRLGFEVRLRPVSRLLKPMPVAGNRPFAAGAEVDVFLIEALRRYPGGPPEGEGLKRETVYSAWFAARLDGAARLEGEAVLTRFARTRVARQRAAPEGPDAVLQGELSITDPVRFAALLENGVGRHRAYGFGMLLLRPRARAGC